MPYELNYDEFPDCMREFANYKRAIQGCSAKTVEEYMTDLRTFSRYLVVVKSGLELSDETLRAADIAGLSLDFFGKIKQSEITEYLSYSMDGRGNNEKTRSRKLSSIKAFYKYFVSKVHKLEVNPAVEIETPRSKRSLPKYLSLDESLALLEAVKKDTENPNRKRDICVFTLFLNCGIRLSELCGINIGDIADDLSAMRVVGKGNKERIVYLNEACRHSVRDFLPVRAAQRERAMEEARLEKEQREKNKDGNAGSVQSDKDEKKWDDKALFVSRLGKRISPKTVQWTVKKYLGQAGLSLKGYSTHKLRHTAATLMYQSGEVDIRVLKDILGHEQLTTTQIYTHVSDKNMKAAMEKNPLASVDIDDE